MRPRKTDPRIYERPAETMGVVRTVGDPNVVGADAIKAIYGAVYTLKFAMKKAETGDFKVAPLRARWEGLDTPAHEGMKGTWGLPLPPGTKEIPQKSDTVHVDIEEWEYGMVAEVLHVGPYAEEPPTIARLCEFIEAEGYEIAGLHEEEYLTRPDAKTVKTIIRYPVRKAS